MAARLPGLKTGKIGGHHEPRSSTFLQWGLRQAERMTISDRRQD